MGSRVLISKDLRRSDTDGLHPHWGDDNAETIVHVHDPGVRSAAALPLVWGAAPERACSWGATAPWRVAQACVNSAPKNTIRVEPALSIQLGRRRKVEHILHLRHVGDLDRGQHIFEEAVKIIDRDDFAAGDVAQLWASLQKDRRREFWQEGRWQVEVDIEARQPREHQDLHLGKDLPPRGVLRVRFMSRPPDSWLDSHDATALTQGGQRRCTGAKGRTWQIVFAWSDGHLHGFRIHGKKHSNARLGGSNFDGDARRVPLVALRLHGIAASAVRKPTVSSEDTRSLP